MKIFLDENGGCLRDVDVEREVRGFISRNTSIHTGQMLVLTWARSILRQMPIEERPEVEWWVYGKQVHFDENLKSFDAWQDARTLILDDALMILL